MADPSSSTDFEARLAGRYQIQRLLGRGGMGAVHLARDLQLDRLVAIKELPAEFASDPMLRERFLREVRMAASFSHPNIVPVYAVEEHGQSLAFVMGFVEGESLAERVRRAGPLSSREALRLLLDVAYALAYAHGRGVVHRDIKPDNIMIERATGRALLMDFGVARLIDTAASPKAGMTRVGEVVGTPEYMSPEQATAEELDGRSDLYSLGLVAYFAVTGTVAFGGDSAARILVRQLTEALPSIATIRSDLPPALAAAIDRCLHKERDERFADAALLIEALDAAQAGAPDVPVAIRLFAQEAETFGMLASYAALLAVLMLSGVYVVGNIWDRMIPVVMLVAVIVGRFMQTRAEARRLILQGYSVDFVMRGFRQTVDEREERRAQLRLDPDVRMRRTRTFRMGAFMLVSSVLLARGAFSMRTGSDGNYHTPPAGILMLFSGLWLFGFGMVLVTRSPLRMSMWERLFRIAWLGAPGRAFLRSVAPDNTDGTRITGSVQTAVRSVVAAPIASPMITAPSRDVPTRDVPTRDVTTRSLSTSEEQTNDMRLNSLESRVARLEEKFDIN